MTDPKARGIVNPWARKPVEPARPEDMPVDTRTLDNVAWSVVVLEGQVAKLCLGYLPCKGRDRFADASDNFGQCLLKLLAKSPALRAALARQSIGTDRPLGSKIAFAFGPVTLYAKASSQQLELAQKMAIDRLCAALTETRARDFDASKTLDDFHISVAVKTA